MLTRPVPLASIPSQPVTGLHMGPLDIHVYGLMYVAGRRALPGAAPMEDSGD